MLHDVKTTVMLIEANAVVGMVPKDSNGDGRIRTRGNIKCLPKLTEGPLNETAAR